MTQDEHNALMASQYNMPTNGPHMVNNSALNAQQLQSVMMGQAAQAGVFAVNGGGVSSVATQQKDGLLRPITACTGIAAEDRVDFWQVIVTTSNMPVTESLKFEVQPVVLVLNEGRSPQGRYDYQYQYLFSTEAKAREWVQAQVRNTFRKQAAEMVGALVRAGLERGLLADEDLNLADALRKYSEGAK